MEQIALSWGSEPNLYSVSELTQAMCAVLSGEFSDIWVSGEISGTKLPPSGHYYFTLKDESAQIRCVCYRMTARYLKFKPQDGVAVLVRGRVELYDARGELQLIVEVIEPQGHGALQLAFEQLKKKLAAEGLFDPARKRPLPAMPERIGIVTSPSGAVIQDILNILERRFPGRHIRIYPAQVQGEGSVEQVVTGIEYFSRTGWADVVIVARGGGSLEDLWTFNDEGVARAIAESTVPVISAVGHETDFTIADFVADLRAPTPSAAAELVTEAQHKIADHIAHQSHRLERAIRFLLMRGPARFVPLSAAAAFARMRNAIARRQQRVDELQYQLDAAWHRQSRQLTEKLQKLEGRLLRQDVSHRMRMVRERLAALDGRICRSQKQLLLRNTDRQR